MRYLIIPVAVLISSGCESPPRPEAREDTLTHAPSETPSVEAGTIPVEITAETLLGLRHAGSPFGNRAHAGWLLPSREDGVVYGHEIHIFDEKTFLLLDSLTERVFGSARWKVVAVLEVPPTTPTEIVSGGLCAWHGTRDRYITAIYRRPEEDVEWYEDVRAAWRVDTDTGVFEPIDPANVRCVNDGYGA